MIHQTGIAPVHDALLYIEPAMFILCKTGISPIDLAILYIIPAAFIVYLSQSRAGPVNLAILYIVPAAIVFDQIAVFPVHCTFFYIIPAALMIHQTGITPVHDALLYIEPAMFIPCQAGIRPLDCSLFYIIPAALIIYLSQSRTGPVDLTILYIVPAVIVFHQIGIAGIHIPIRKIIPVLGNRILKQAVLAGVNLAIGKVSKLIANLSNAVLYGRRNLECKLLTSTVVSFSRNSDTCSAHFLIILIGKAIVTSLCQGFFSILYRDLRLNGSSAVELICNLFDFQLGKILRINHKSQQKLSLIITGTGNQNVCTFLTDIDIILILQGIVFPLFQLFPVRLT